MQAGYPAFGAFFQSGNGRFRQIQIHELIQKLADFSRDKAQILLANFGHLATRPQASQRKWGVGAAQEQQMKTGRRVVEQELEAIMNGRIVNVEIVVEGQEDGLGCLSQRVEQVG